jgi:hypothetical protein
MENGAFPGKREEKFNVLEGNDDYITKELPRALRNKYVTTMHRSKAAVRQEVIQIAIYFLKERLNEEQASVLADYKVILESKPLFSFLEAGPVLETR